MSSLSEALVDAGKAAGLTMAAQHIADEAMAGRLATPVALRLIREISALAPKLEAATERTVA